MNGLVVEGPCGEGEAAHRKMAAVGEARNREDGASAGSDTCGGRPGSCRPQLRAEPHWEGSCAQHHHRFKVKPWPASLPPSPCPCASPPRRRVHSAPRASPPPRPRPPRPSPPRAPSRRWAWVPACVWRLPSTRCAGHPLSRLHRDVANSEPQEGRRRAISDDVAFRSWRPRTMSAALKRPPTRSDAVHIGLAVAGRWLNAPPARCTGIHPIRREVSCVGHKLPSRNWGRTPNGVNSVAMHPKPRLRAAEARGD